MVRIGATGHRLISEQEKISAGIETALERIEELCPRSRLTAVSSLAEGADCLIVKHILKRRAANLIVPLPLQQHEYLQDFVVPQAKAEFHALLARADKVIQLPPCSSREKSYEAAAEYLLRNCDILLAVWDGCAAQGKGGTGYVVKLARELGVPIAWVHAGNRKAGTNEPTSLGEDQGRAEFERLDALIQNRK